MKIKIQTSKRGAIISLSVAFATVLIDFLTKIAVMANMEKGESIPIIKNVLHITYITNDGAAFGSFSEHRWLFMTVSILLIVFLGGLILFFSEANELFYASVSMVLGGGIGNMIDRIAYGEVVDFIDFCAFPKLWSWIFNGADSFVCIGAGMLVLWFILSEVDHSKKQRAEGETVTSENVGEKNGKEK